MTIEALWAAAAASSPNTWPAWSGGRARSIPGVGRALGLYRGLVGQMPLERLRGVEVLPGTPMLNRPDPTRPRSWFVSQHVDDLLMHGNALHLITSRDSDGWPLSVLWLPASRITLKAVDGDWARPEYRLDAEADGNGELLPADDVVHVQRGADPGFPWRGVGVIEQHLSSLGRIYNQESFESSSLVASGVPSVAVIAPNPRISDDEIKQARRQWDELYGGPGRVPGIFPQGTEIKPLAWSPTDAQMTEARQMSLTDTANIFNLDGYWLGAPASSHTYRSPGPLFTAMVRTSLEPVLIDLEQEWAYRWLPRGQSLRFRRQSVEQDTLPEAVATVATAMTTIGADGQPLMTTQEGRAALMWTGAPNTQEGSTTSPGGGS